MRIVSLLPAATEIVHFLGLWEALVGVSADSDWPSAVQALPVLNTISIDTATMTSREIDAAAADERGHRGASLYHVDPDLLRQVHPDLILTQEVCEVCAVSRQDVEVAARTLGYTPTVLSLTPATLDQVLEDVQTVADAAGVAERGRALTGELRARLEAVRDRMAGVARPRVFCMEWLDPPYSAGHWVPEMVAIAGGRDELGQRGGYSQRIDWQTVVAYQPDIIVLMPCSLPLERVRREFENLRQLPGWKDVPAVRHQQVFAGETHLFSQSGPRLVDGVEVLASMLHPEVAGIPAASGQALRMSADGKSLEPFS